MTSKEPTSSQELTFEQALEQLDDIVRLLEEGQLPLAEGLARYEVAVKLLGRCYHLLERVQRRIEVLNRVDSHGQMDSEPFDDHEIPLEEKAETRGRRRSRPTTSPASEADDVDESGRLF